MEIELQCTPRKNLSDASTENPLDLLRSFATIYINKNFEHDGFISDESDYEGDHMDFTSLVKDDHDEQDMKIKANETSKVDSDAKKNLQFLPTREYHPHGSNLDISIDKLKLPPLTCDNGAKTTKDLECSLEYPSEMAERVGSMERLSQVFENSLSLTNAKRSKSQWTIANENIDEKNESLNLTKGLFEISSETIKGGLGSDSLKGTGIGDVYDANECSKSLMPLENSISIGGPSYSSVTIIDGYVYKMVSSAESICNDSEYFKPVVGIDIDKFMGGDDCPKTLETLWKSENFLSESSSETSFVFKEKCFPAMSKKSQMDLHEFQSVENAAMAKSSRWESTWGESEISCDERFIGRADIFRPTLTPSERRMLGIASPPAGFLQSDYEPSESDDAKSYDSVKSYIKTDSRKRCVRSISWESYSDLSDKEVGDSESAKLFSDSEPEGWNWKESDGMQFEVTGAKKGEKKFRKGMVYNFPWKKTMKHNQEQDEELEENFLRSDKELQNTFGLNARSKLNYREETIDEVLARRSQQRNKGSLSKAFSNEVKSQRDSYKFKSQLEPQGELGSFSKITLRDPKEIVSYVSSVLPKPKNKSDLKRRRDVILKRIRWLIKTDKNSGVSDLSIRKKYQPKIDATKAEYRKRKYELKVNSLEDRLKMVIVDFEAAKTKLKLKIDKLKEKKLQEVLNDSCDCEDSRKKQVDEKFDEKLKKDLKPLEKSFARKCEQVKKQIEKLKIKWEAKKNEKD